MSHHIVHLFVDGGCPHNGSSEARMFWSMRVEVDGKSLPEFTFDSEKLPNPHTWTEANLPYVPPKSTNNVAELMAVSYAFGYIEMLNKRTEHLGEQCLFQVCTDSEYVLGACKTNKVRANHELVSNLRNSLQQFANTKITVDIAHVERNTSVLKLGH